MYNITSFPCSKSTELCSRFFFLNWTEAWLDNWSWCGSSSQIRIDTVLIKFFFFFLIIYCWFFRNKIYDILFINYDLLRNYVYLFCTWFKWCGRKRYYSLWGGTFLLHLILIHKTFLKEFDSYTFSNYQIIESV